jgi:hypothetical protein
MIRFADGLHKCLILMMVNRLAEKKTAQAIKEREEQKKNEVARPGNTGFDSSANLSVVNPPQKGTRF